MIRILPIVVLAAVLATVFNTNLAEQNVTAKTRTVQQVLSESDLKPLEKPLDKNTGQSTVPMALAIIEPPKPVSWAVETVPHGQSNSLQYINEAIAYYQDLGMTKQGVAMLVGNYLQEMPEAFTNGNPCDPSGYGDGGKALGLAQWHPSRRADMPCGFKEQLSWALTEMQRHRGGQKLYPLLFDQNASTDQLRAGIKAWEVYGVAGSRYQYGINILNQL